MAGIVLTVEQRERVGSGGARASRRSDLIPGVLYGGTRGSIPIELKAVEVQRALRSGKFVSHMIEIEHKGERQPVIPKAIQYHPVTDEPLHIDLYRVEEGAILDIEVPVHFKNHEASPGLKRGGALNIAAHTLKLHVPANAIPEEIVIDLTGIEIGTVLHVSSITLPAGVTSAVKDRDVTIATITGRIAADPEPAAAAAAAAPAEEKKS